MNITTTQPKAAMSVAEFCNSYGICKTKAFAEIKAGHLVCRKFGRRTLIATEAAEAWFRNLATKEAA